MTGSSWSAWCVWSSRLDPYSVAYTDVSVDAGSFEPYHNARATCVRWIGKAHVRYHIPSALCILLRTTSLPCTSTPLLRCSQAGGLQVLFFFLAVGFIKLSIVFFYMRLSGFASRKWMIAHWVLVSILSSYLVTVVFLQTCHCRPVGNYWSLLKLGHLDSIPVCIDPNKYAYFQNITHIVTDWTLLVVPIVMLWKVQMKWTLKLRIYIAGFVGVACCICAVARTIIQFRWKSNDVTCRLFPTLPQILSG